MKTTKAEITKDLLINSALNVLCTTSFKGARMLDVAKKVGLSRGAIYWHFESKIDLYNQVMTHSFDKGMKEIYLILKKEDSVENVITDVVDYLLGERLETHHKSAVLYNGLHIENPEGLEEIIERVDQLFQTLFKKYNLLLKKGIRRGEIKADIDTKFETRTMFNFLWGYFTNKDKFFSGYSSNNIRDFVIKRFLKPVLN